jgi:uncharacterized membrane protein YbhN (UPF0104 family)
MSREWRGALQALAALLIVGVVVFFFRAQFVKNWNQVRDVHFQIDYFLLVLAFVCILAAYLINTAAWRYGMNLSGAKRPFSFRQSIGMVNTTQLTKYIPGKIWGYAMQVALLDRKEFSVSTVLYINLFLALSSVFICLLLGGFYFIFFSLLVPRLISAIATAAVLLTYVFFLGFNGRFFSLLTKVFERISKRRIVACRITLKQTMWMQLFSLISSAALGMSALLCAIGMGFPVHGRLVYSVISGFLFSDTIGFLAFLVPGGVGIREGLFYLLLQEHGGQSLALILPIVMRLMSMLVDALLGLLGLIYLRTYMKDTAQ